jgi:hypothetical protein
MRLASLVHVDDAFWRYLLAEADIVSEGATTQEGEQMVYRGTTSIILPSRAFGGEDDLRRVASIAHVAASDPHFRVRVMRIARREAVVRAAGRLGSTIMELLVRPDPHGIRADVDVDGAVCESSGKVKHGRESF